MNAFAKLDRRREKDIMEQPFRGKSRPLPLTEKLNAFLTLAVLIIGAVFVICDWVHT